MEKLKFKALKGLFGMFVFFGILKKCNYLFMPEQDFLFNIVILLQANIFRFFSSNHGHVDTS